jgi:hypothetical protein
MTGFIKEHAMRVALAFAVAMAIGSLSLSAQRTVSTPPQAVHIFQANGLMQVLCARTDANFNGVADEGDAPAAWLQVTPTLQVVRSYTFPWADVKASRIGTILQRDRLFVGVDNAVQEFDLTDQALKGTVYTGPVSAVSAIESASNGPTLYISQRPNFTDPGTVVQRVVATGDSVVYAAGPNPQQSLRFTTSTNVSGLLTISEGVFGQANGIVDVWKQSALGAARTTITVGDTPNHVTVSGDSAYVTVNGSHHVVVIDLVSVTAVDTIAVGTSGFDGPRESVVDNGILYVSTFSSDVRLFSIEDGRRIGVVTLDAKPEGILVFGRDLWVTRSFLMGGYSAESNVAVYDLDAAVSVEADATRPNMPKAIVATGTSVTLPLDAGKGLTMRTLEGRQTAVRTVDSERCTIDVSSLPRGVYVVSDGTSSITLMR